MKPKQQRLVLALAALAAIVVAAFLALSGLRERASYFYAPSDIARSGIPVGRHIRLGGMVAPASIRRAADGVTIDFVVRDESNRVAARFRGVPPDLFRENSGVIAEGRFEGGVFVADKLLAKHDENYRPPQLAGLRHKTTTLVQP